MKKFWLGFLVGALVICLIWLIFSVLIPGFKSAQERNKTQELDIECPQINPGIKDSGNLKITITYQDNPASNLETDLSQSPGADQYCYKNTDENGIVEFKNIPTGNYFIYFNMSNYPDKYGIPSAEESVQINKDEMLEMEMELENYQK